MKFMRTLLDPLFLERVFMPERAAERRNLEPVVQRLADAIKCDRTHHTIPLDAVRKSAEALGLPPRHQIKARVSKVEVAAIIVAALAATYSVLISSQACKRAEAAHEVTLEFSHP